MIYLYAFVTQANMRPGKSWWRDVYEKSKWPEQDEVVEDNGAGIHVIRLSSDLVLTDSLTLNSFADPFRGLVERQGGNVP